MRGISFKITGFTSAVNVCLSKDNEIVCEKYLKKKKGPLCALRHQGRKLLDCNCLCWIVWSFQFDNLVELNCFLMISISLNGFVNAPNERMPETVYACSPHVVLPGVQIRVWYCMSDYMLSNSDWNHYIGLGDKWVIWHVQLVVSMYRTQGTSGYVRDWVR